MIKKKINFRSSELKQRGWTEGLIKKFLPKPDELKTNLIVKSAAPMKLYKITRVEKIEKSEKFIKEIVSISKRKIAAQKAVETKTTKTLEWANSVKIDVPSIDKDKLLRNASTITSNTMIRTLVPLTKTLQTESVPTI